MLRVSIRATPDKDPRHKGRSHRNWRKLELALYSTTRTTSPQEPQEASMMAYIGILWENIRSLPLQRRIPMRRAAGCFPTPRRRLRQLCFVPLLTAAIAIAAIRGAAGQ